MMIPSVTVYQSSAATHTNLIITGLQILKERNMIHLAVHDCRGMPGCPDPDIFITRLVVEGLTLWFDTGDGYAYGDAKLQKTRDFYAQGDFCFRRSWSAEENRRCFPGLEDRIFPLGMNYFVLHPNAPIKIYGTRKSMGKRLLRRLARIQPDDYFTYKVFEHPANPCEGEPRILFFARLWEPKENPMRYEQQNEQISNDRIRIVRMLKREFPKTFSGGITDTPYARKVCRELLVSKYSSRRENFLRLVKQSDICIASRGLSESTGWKTAEYVAASRAIVSERIRFEVPGKFADGVNYLSYETPDECVERVARLCQDKDRIYEMKRANETYYREYMRPDRQMWRAIQFALEQKA